MRILLTAAIAGTLAAAPGCTERAGTEHSADPVLVQVGDTALRMSQVVARIPPGLSPQDSATMFANIVDVWLRDALLRDVAAENIVDMQKIDRLSEQYRTNLIINEYLERISEQRGDAATERQVREYYDANSEKMLLERPLVKGIFIKLPSDADRLDEVRRWVKSSSRASIDNIEKYGLKGAIQYDYFMDRWVDLQTIAEAIPHSFGNFDDWVKSHRDLETSSNGSTYFLHITEWLGSGSVMPYDFAAAQIRQMLMQQNRSRYADRLMNTLMTKARKEGTLTTPGYDPASHRLISNTENNRK